MLLKNGAELNDYEWSLISDYKWMIVLTLSGHYPRKNIVTNVDCQIELSISLCRLATLQTLQIGKLANQPMCHLWKIIARFLHTTRRDLIWLETLPQ
jgi:hypothetical protein